MNDLQVPLPPRLRVGMVVSDPIRIEGLVALLSSIVDLIPMTPADTVRDPDLAMVLIDAEDTLFSLMAAFRRARPGLSLIVLGSSVEPKYIGQVVAAGAKGYLSHTASAKEIVTAISVVADGSIWAPRKVLASLIETYSPEEPRRAEVRFTNRERVVLKFLVNGNSDREIALKLGLSPRTVQNLVGGLLRKIGVSNRVALTVRALERYVL